MKEVFFILQNGDGQQAANLSYIFRCIGDVEIISDGERGTEDASDLQIKFLKKLINRDISIDACKNYWVIDDRLAGDWISLTAFVENTICEQRDFSMDSLPGGLERNISSPFHSAIRLKGSALCRLRNSESFPADSLDNIISWMVEPPNNLSFLLWAESPRFARFINRSTESARMGLRFPVHDLKSHTAHCNLNLDLQDNVGGKIADLDGDHCYGWYVRDVARWKKWFSRSEKTRILEVGASDGICTNSLLDILFAHPESEAHSIVPLSDIDSSSAERASIHYVQNGNARGNEKQLSTYEGNPTEILSWMISAESYWEGFDFIYIRPDQVPFNAMSSAFLTWHLLKPGGVLVFDCAIRRIGAEHPSKSSLRVFRSFVGNHCDLLRDAEIIALRKRPAA